MNRGRLPVGDDEVVVLVQLPTANLVGAQPVAEQRVLLGEHLDVVHARAGAMRDGWSTQRADIDREDHVVPVAITECLSDQPLMRPEL